MTGWQRVAVWMSATVVGLTLAGLGGFFALAGLDKSDKLASVIGAFGTLVGLGLSGYGVLLSRRPSPLVPGAQRVDQVVARGGVDMVDGVGGNVRVGNAARPVKVVPPPPAPPDRGPVAEQTATDVRTAGVIRMIRGVDGDVDIAP
jgi:hypothetical protein